MLIVEDEQELRDGLYNWPWESLNIKASGCCSHGLEALQFLASNPVDILLTDIRMPFMDGNELMEVLSRQYPFIHVIVLSAYSEFEYVRKALQAGAVDYMLKPIVFEDMIRCIKKLTGHLEAQKQIEQRMNFLQMRTQQLSRVLREKFLGELFRSPFSASELEQYGAEGEVLLEDDTHTAAVLRMERLISQKPPLTKQEKELILFSLNNILAEKWDVPGWSYHLVKKDTMDVYLLTRGCPEKVKYENLMKHLLQYKGLFKSTFTIVSGPAVPGPGSIYSSLKAALEQISDSPANTINICMRNINPLSNSGEYSSIESDDYLQNTGNNMDGFILAKARQFIRENYNRSITLKEVAEHVYISQSHLSALFKMSGDTFLKFLTDIRMKHARELMADLKYNIYDIAEKVGYSDTAYFSELFKKHTGMTPNEYRKRLKLTSFR